MYDQASVARALAALEEAGGSAAAASRAVGVPRSTISCWAAGRIPHEARPAPAPVRPRRDFGTRAEAVTLVLSGASVPEAAARVGASRNAVYNWLRKHRDGGWAAVAAGAPGGGPTAVKGKDEGPREHAYDGFEGTLEERIRQLEVENAILREVNEVLKGVRPGEMSNREKTLVIDSLRAKADIPLRELTASLRISKSSYEYQRRAIARGDRHARLRKLVREAFEGPGGGARGYRFVTRALRELPDPVAVSEKVVRRIMREEGLVPRWMRRRRAWSSYAGEPTPAPENLVGRDFHSALPNFLWLTDITEFNVPGAGRCYLSAIRDCFDSSIVAWRIGAHPTADLANATLADACARLACARLAPGEAPVIHSDRGGHYRWPGWMAICEEHGLTRSMSAKGCSPDNAAMEGFFGLLKREFFHGRDWGGWSLRSFMDALDEWIVGYNRDRKCGALDHMTPLEFRNSLGKAA